MNALRMSGKMRPEIKDERKPKKQEGLLIGIFNWIVENIEKALGIDDGSDKRSFGNRVRYAWRALLIGEFSEFKNIIMDKYEIPKEEDDDEDGNEEKKKKKDDKQSKEGEKGKKRDGKSKKVTEADLEKIQLYKWAAEILFKFILYGNYGSEYDGCIQESNSVAETLQVFIECSGAITAYKDVISNNKSKVVPPFSMKGLKELNDFNGELSYFTTQISKTSNEL